VIRGLLSMLLLSGLAIGCGRNGSPNAAEIEPGLSGSVTVAAAASLTEAFEQIGEEFTAANPAARVQFNFDASTTLSQQVIDGAPADALASADEANMTKVVDAGKVEAEPVIIATNSLMIVVKPGNPFGVRALEDLKRVDVVSLCGRTVPCGRLAQESLGKAGVSIPAETITRGQNAKTTIAAVGEGDADAGVVYATDVQAAGVAVEGIAIPTEHNSVATYPMAVLTDASNPALSRTFVDFVLGERGQAILRAAGYSPP